ncbi:MAG: ATP-binding protein [Rhodomicrobium sp.]
MPSIYPLFSLTRSASAKLAIISILFIVSVALVRSLSLGSLNNVDILSSELRNRWLDSVQILGSLRHHVARVRTEEAEMLLGGDTAARKQNAAELSDYLNLISENIASYRKVPHGPDETSAFDEFITDWNTHVGREREFVTLAESGRVSDAIALFHGSALSTFRKASHELHQLLLLTHSKLDRASKEAARSIARAQRFISELILAVLVLFIGLAVYLWYSFSRPLLDLAGRTHRLSTNDTNFRIPFQERRDEVGEMAHALSVLQKNTVELLQTRKSLSMQAEILAGTLEKERQLTAAQRNFLTTISHEFRTPLTYIDGHAQRLISTRMDVEPERIAERAGKIRAAVFQLTSLLSSLTAEMDMMSKSGEVEKCVFDPGAMLKDLAGYYNSMGLKVRFVEKAGDLPKKMTGDPKLLRCAFSNLIANAFKYSPEGGIVEVSGTRENGSIAITIADHGIGIPPGELPHVRERFFRGSNVGQIPGTGIGLSLVQQIVEQHGGRLSIDSDPGEGTRVTVSLPATNAEKAPPEYAREHHLMH